MWKGVLPQPPPSEGNLVLPAFTGTFYSTQRQAMLLVPYRQASNDEPPLSTSSLPGKVAITMALATRSRQRI